MDICKRAKKSAKKICIKGCVGDYPGCTRCHEKGFSMLEGKQRHLGEDTVCPLEKYKIPDQPVPKTFMEAMDSAPTQEDCLWICANCEYATLNEDAFAEGYLQVDRADKEFLQHCLDCPVEVVLSCIQETEAEAAMS